MRSFASSSSAVGVDIHGRMMSAQSLYVANPGITRPTSQNQSLTNAVANSAKLETKEQRKKREKQEKRAERRGRGRF